MNVFLTGGTGLIGSAVVVELLANDHSVVALARSEASALALKSAGAEPVRGDLADLDALRSGAAESDGVIHLAFSHDFSSPDAIARAVAEESSAVRLGQPVETVPAETYGPLGPIFATDQPASSTHTRRTLGWEPTHASLLEDLENIQA